MEQENGKQDAENEEVIMSPEEQKQYSREMVEKEKGKVMSWSDVNSELPDLFAWLKKCNFSVEDKMLVFKEKEERVKTVYRLYFWTSEHRYSLVIVLKNDGDTYMGGLSQKRKTRPGEFHTRGSDLPDGKYTKETFDKFLNEVLEKEMKPLDAHYL